MAFPVTLNGRTYTLADFEGQNYVEGLPDAFEDFVTHAGNTYVTTSTSSVAIGAGSKTLTVADSGKPYTPGTPLRIAYSADPSNFYMDSIVTSYSGTTLVVDVKLTEGTGTYASWNINFGVSGGLVSEIDTLDDVTGRGATTTNDISVGDVTADQFVALANGAKMVVSTGNPAFTDFLGGSTDNTSDDGLFAFYGGRAYNQGAGVVLYGDDHATLPNAISFRNGAFVERFAINADGTATFKSGVQESKNAVTSSSGALAIDCADGNVFSLALSENVTSITFSNVPSTGTAFGLSLFVTQDSTARTISWPASVAWPSGTAPTLSSASGDVDVFTLTTFDGGTNWYAIVSGQAL